MTSRSRMNLGIFRAYDIRGVVDEDLTEDVVNRIAKAVGTYLRQRGAQTIVAGHDARLSSPAYHRAATEGLLSTGLDVLSIGLVPTPVMYFAIKHFETDGGIMITASHNPPQFNGIKLRCGTQPLVTEGLQEVAGLADREEFASGSGTVHEVNAIEPYIRTVSEKFALANPLRIVADYGNGCSGLVAPHVLSNIGCDVVDLYPEPDGTFPHHHPDPMKEENLGDLKAKVVQTSADVGVAFDGDGDRLGIVDNKGNTVTPDQFLALLARLTLPDHPGAKVVSEVKVSQMLIEEVERLGGEFVMTRVGYPFLLAAMREHQALFGGELSGHYYFRDPDIDFDDGTFASATLVNMLAKAGKDLASLISELPHYPGTLEIAVPCPDDQKVAVVEAIRQTFSRNHKVIDIDGARVLFADGWGVVRPSNTEPRLTLRFEGRTEEALDRIMGVFRQALQQQGLQPTF